MNTRFPVDLHCHTTASDGLYSPYQVVAMAKSLGLKGIGITDHDTIAGWEEAEAAGEKLGIRVIKGIEFNTELNGIEVHILGYEFDSCHNHLTSKLRELQEARMARIERMIQKLNSIGVDITLSEVRSHAQGESMGRPHVAQVLVEKRYAQSVKDAFNQYLAKGAPAFVERVKLTPETAIKLIREAGGVAALAHPASIRQRLDLENWSRAGLQGIEVCHSDHSLEDELKFMNIAAENCLIPTGGSDFHGEARKPGVVLGKWGTSMEIVEQILRLSAKGERYCQKGAK